MYSLVAGRGDCFAAGAMVATIYWVQKTREQGYGTCALAMCCFVVTREGRLPSGGQLHWSCEGTVASSMLAHRPGLEPSCVCCRPCSHGCQDWRALGVVAGCCGAERGPPPRVQHPRGQDHLGCGTPGLHPQDADRQAQSYEHHQAAGRAVR